MPEQDGQGEAEANTESGKEEAKGGENVQKINREDVVQAALIVERWCAATDCRDCPLLNDEDCCMVSMEAPDYWRLENQLRNRGISHGKV